MDEYRIVSIKRVGDINVKTDVPFLNEQDIRYYLEHPLQDGVEYRVYLGKNHIVANIPPSREGHCSICDRVLIGRPQKYCSDCRSLYEAFINDMNYQRSKERMEQGDTEIRYCSTCFIPIEQVSNKRQYKYCKEHRLDGYKEHKRTYQKRYGQKRHHPERITSETDQFPQHES